MITVRLPDGSTRELDDGATGLDVGHVRRSPAGPSGGGGAVNGAPVDLGMPLPDGAEVAVITGDSEAGRAVLRHSTAHVMAQAVLQLWPGAHYAIGPAIDGRLLLRLRAPRGAHFTDDDLDRIEEEMRAIMAEDQPFVREEHSVREGLSLFADQPFKLEIIEGVAARVARRGVVARGIRRHRPRCRRGQRVPNTTSSSTSAAAPTCRRRADSGISSSCGWPARTGAATSSRPQLQRIYGTAWESDKALAEHLHRLEEAERRDHRRLGAELDLFSFPPEIGSGLAVFHPKGGIIRRLMEDYSRRRHDEAGYQFVNTPHIAKSELFETSGHLDWYAEGMYPPMELDEGQRYYVKPMNCPFHILIYRSRQRSYRELPMRLFEFGSVYRYEKSGVVHGLTRVRGMTQDDAHIFCTARADGRRARVAARLRARAAARLRPRRLLPGAVDQPGGQGRRGGRGVGRGHRGAARGGRRSGTRARLDEGGGAFYGPKISVQARDAIGRYWQVSTIQLDFQTPAALRPGVRRCRQRPSPTRHDPPRPVRFGGAVLGDPPRALRGRDAHLAHARSRSPCFPCATEHDDYGRHAVTSAARRAGLRVEVDSADEPLSARIRRRKLEKVPYVLVVGDDDVTAGTVGVNRRGSKRPDRGVASRTSWPSCAPRSPPGDRREG